MIRCQIKKKNKKSTDKSQLDAYSQWIGINSPTPSGLVSIYLLPVVWYQFTYSQWIGINSPTPSGSVPIHLLPEDWYQFTYSLWIGINSPTPSGVVPIHLLPEDWYQFTYSQWRNSRQIGTNPPGVAELVPLHRE